MNEGNWRMIWSGLVKVAKNDKSQANEDNIVSALINPTLRNLKLINGDGKDLKLTNDGKQCLAAYGQEGINGFKKRLGLQVILIDQSSVDLASYLLSHHNSAPNAVTVTKLRSELFSLGIKNADKVTPVQGWVNLMEYVGILRKTEGGYHIVESQYRALRDGEKMPSITTVREAFYNTSRELRGSTFGSPYIPIPEFREHVCKELGITSFTFEKLITQLIRDEKLRIVLATPTRRVTEGITIGGKYYYFIAVYSR